MKQSIISIGMTACCLSGNGQSLFAANKPAQEERPNILFILSDDHTSQSWGIYGGVLGEYARNENIRRLARRVAYWIIVFVRTRSLLRVARRS